MASTSPAAPELSVKPVHGVDLASSESESACDSAAATQRFHAVPADAVVSVLTAIDHEDALAAGEFAMVIVMFLTWWSVSLSLLCRRPRASAGL